MKNLRKRYISHYRKGVSPKANNVQYPNIWTPINSNLGKSHYRLFFPTKLWTYKNVLFKIILAHKSISQVPSIELFQERKLIVKISASKSNFGR